VAGQWRGRDRRLALGLRDRPELASRRHDESALGDVRAALLVQQAHQRLADTELGDRLLDPEIGVGAHGLGGRFHRLLVLRREGAQRVLHAVAELPEHRLGDVERVLRHEVHAHALGADQAHHLLDLLQERLGRIAEEQVRLVEEEDELGLVGVAQLGQLLEELREHPQEEGRVELRRIHQLVGGQDVHHAP
jgi:hypothetical protein